tara:strand:+ start:1108 stop:1968 length:861 start_codon:yes stop_codon:yes gene_type:complete
MFTKKFILKILLIYVFIFNISEIKKINSLVPFFNLPTENELKNNSLSLGQKAYQLLYFGQLKDSLRLAELAISINENDEKLWALLAEVQVANNLYEEALESIKKGKILNPSLGELYFAESSIYLKQKKRNSAKESLIQGIKLNSTNSAAMFQLGNIFLIEKKYNKALNYFNKTIEIDPLFWQAINNKGLIYFELNKIKLSVKNFESAIKLKDDAEPLLALAVALQNDNPTKSIFLAKKALKKNPKYVDANYRKEQLWGQNLQKATKILFEFQELKEDIISAKLYKK